MGTLRSGASHRARRWDVLVLGGALPGLIAAIRLAMKQLRVLVVEEDLAARRPDILRDPFHLPAAAGGPLDRCLQALGLPINERRLLERDPTAYQVLLPDARVEVGGTERTAEELAAWGLADDALAAEWVRDLERAARAECEALLEADVVRRGGLRALSSRSRSAGEGPAGAPNPEDPRLQAFFGAQEHALGGLAEGAAAPEARSRLLGAALTGDSAFASAEGGLRALLRRRLEGLHGEFRTLGCPFEFVELGEHPGIARIGPGDVWLGRALILNAPRARLVAALRDWEREVPGFLAHSTRPSRACRVSLHLRARSEVVPEGLQRRAIAVRDPAGPLCGPNVFTLAAHPSTRGRQFTELVASANVPDEADKLPEVAQALEEGVRELMPFSEGGLAAAPLPARPRWDDESALPAPEAGTRSPWPGAVDIRAAGRRKVYALPRDGLAGLGVEGDLLVGWRAGDAIRSDLA